MKITVVGAGAMGSVFSGLLAAAGNEVWAIALGCMREAFDLGVARSVEFSFADPNAYVTAFGRSMEAHPSMLQDHRAGRASEIDASNGMVVTLGREMGLPTPYNETISANIKARESAFQKM